MAYLETLLCILKRTSIKPTNNVVLSYLGNPIEHDVKQRFQLMLQDKPSARRKVRLWVSYILCMVLFITSYLVILQPAFSPPVIEDGDSLVILTPQNSYILHTDDGKYVIYYNDDFYSVITSEESLLSQPYCDLSIIQEGGTKP